MFTIFHGENTVLSRKALMGFLEQQKTCSVVVRVDAQALDQLALESMLYTQELFSPKKTLVFEGLHDLVKSKRKDILIETISKASMLPSFQHDVVLWEKKTLTLPQLKKFPQAKTMMYKTSSLVFMWLDSLRPKNTSQMLSLFHDAQRQDGEELCFAMLIRQARLLLQIKAGMEIKLAPFALVKLKKQANFFSLEQLQKIHEELLKIDESIKNSSSALSLVAKLDLLLLWL